MLEKILNAIRQFSMLSGGERVTVALSGGADSMSLLYALRHLSKRLNISITAVHFNHNIRGEEANRDENFVRLECEKLNIPLFIGSGDVLTYAKQKKISLELAAREMRYEFFNSLDTDLIATAHTASDNLETIIFNLARGTSLSGLCGIPPKRDKLIRPLIFCSREDVEKFCADNDIAYVTDSTNLCDEYSRNKIRHSVIPHIKEINEAVEKNISKTAASLLEIEDFLSQIVEQEYSQRVTAEGLSLEGAQKLHSALVKLMIIKFYQGFFGERPDNYHINEIYGIVLSGGKTSVQGNMQAVNDNNILRFLPISDYEAETEFTVEISKKDNDLFNNTKKVHNLFLKNVLDCDKIVGELCIRTRQEGDTICLKNKNCTKTLKKLYNEYKIPLIKRRLLPVISDDCGVVWIYGIGVADRAAADEKTKRIYKIQVYES